MFYQKKKKANHSIAYYWLSQWISRGNLSNELPFYVEPFWSCCSFLVVMKLRLSPCECHNDGPNFSHRMHHKVTGIPRTSNAICSAHQLALRYLIWNAYTSGANRCQQSEKTIVRLAPWWGNLMGNAHYSFSCPIQMVLISIILNTREIMKRNEDFFPPLLLLFRPVRWNNAKMASR